jgi:NAD(P)-dependent dehydrogenase (short-subunit alcohol dehydrogenase family)
MTSEPTIHQLFNLAGKTALISGATGYLGQSMARALAEAGANVVVTSRDVDRARTTAAQLPVVGGARHVGLHLDQTKTEELANHFTIAIEQFGSLDILVNNGHEPVTADLTTCTAEQFTRQLANATGYFELARLLRNHVVERKASASVIMLGSMYGTVGSYPDAYEGMMASPVAYHTLKGGILQMTRHLAVYWASDRVRVNSLSPGPFPAATASPKMVQRLCSKSPMQRMGQPYELKGAVVFLASDASSYMTGQNLVIDGGWTSW